MKLYQSYNTPTKVCYNRYRSLTWKKQNKSKITPLQKQYNTKNLSTSFHNTLEVPAMFLLLSISQHAEDICSWQEIKFTCVRHIQVCELPEPRHFPRTGTDRCLCHPTSIHNLTPRIFIWRSLFLCISHIWGSAQVHDNWILLWNFCKQKSKMNDTKDKQKKQTNKKKLARETNIKKGNNRYTVPASPVRTPS